MGLLKEFKEFALKGNIVDLAVAVIIGGAFGKIVTALTQTIIMPLISLLIREDKCAGYVCNGREYHFPYRRLSSGCH